MSKTRTVRRFLGRLITLYIPLAFFIFFFLAPFYWMFITSLKENKELYNLQASRLWVSAPTLRHYQELFTETAFLVWIKNSFLVALIVTSFSLVIGIMAAYALSRLRFKGGTAVGAGVFITYLVPPTLLFIPLASVVHRLGLYDSWWALVVTYPTFMVPFCVWLLTGYFRSIPPDMEECAMIDGCSRFQAIWRITVPLAVPGLVSAGIFAFTMSWNEFIYGLTFLQSSSQRTVPVAVPTEFVLGDAFFWGPMMAAALLGSVPIAIAYAFFARYYVEGMTSGAIKG
jgi:multiple sugar transport system permease protein